MSSKLNYMKVNQSFCGGSLQGYITIKHSELVKVLGEGMGPGDKSLDEWEIEDELDGETVAATIYDWKNYGMSAHNITNWHIGGNGPKSVELVRKVFPNAIIKVGWY